jgi:hypothetical protein
MIESGLASAGMDEEWFSTFKFKNVSFEKDSNGNTVITGIGADQSITENPLFASIAALATMDYESFKSVLTLDSDYRLTSQSLTYSASVMGMMQLDASVMIEYQYGAEFAIANPDPSASYTAVATFEELINELAVATMPQQ